MDTTGFRKFVILLYKGFLLRKRHYIICVLFELLLPVIIACIPAIIQSEANIPSSHSQQTPDWVNETFYPPFDPLLSGPSETYYYTRKVLFVYAPANTHTDILMNKSIELWKSYRNEIELVIQSLENPDDLENFCLRALQDDDDQYVIGTIFNNIHPNDKLPDSLDYTIRYSSQYGSSMFGTNLKYRFSQENYNEYKESYFLSWQASMEKTFISEKFLDESKQLPDYEVMMQRFPYPRHKRSPIAFSFSILVPTMVTYAFIFFVINLIRRVIEEKSNGSKVAQK